MTIQDLISNSEYPQKIILQKLICHFCNISRENLRIKSDQEISSQELEKIINGYNLYVKDAKPLEYILGEVEFFGIKFFVNHHTIIPRPETEYMINAVTEHCQKLSPPDKEGQGRFKHHLPYDKNLTSRAKELRANMPVAEKKIWYNFLKDYKYKFTRQKPIDTYIVDFYSSKLGLVIEIDGDTHRSDEAIDYDKKRTTNLERLGLRIIRFTNEEVLKSFEEVCEVIKNSNPLNPPYHGDLVLMDIGTGCGVLGISVLLQNPSAFKTVFLTDYSQDAIGIAKQNYDNLIKSDQYDTYFVQSDLINFAENYASLISEKNIILLGNLPYIPEKTHDEYNPDSVKKWEPRMAFVGGEDGLIYYYKMFDQILKLKAESGKPKDSLSSTFNLGSLVMFLEMMTRQVDILRSKYSEYFIFEEVKTFHFNIRIVKVYLR